MTKTLAVRLNDAKAELEKIDVALKEQGSALPEPVRQSLADRVAFLGVLPHLQETILAREAAYEFLKDLPKSTNQGMVALGASRVPFRHARLIGTQAYLSLKWSLADMIAAAAGFHLCSVNHTNHKGIGTRLVTHFAAESAEPYVAALVNRSLLNTFGWSIAVSYSLRNHFVHEAGGTKGGHYCFAGDGPEAEFALSENGWTAICNEARGQKFTETMKRDAAWPMAPERDLRLLLKAFERDVDDALGVLLGSAIAVTKTNLAFMLGLD